MPREFKKTWKPKNLNPEPVTKKKKKKKKKKT